MSSYATISLSPTVFSLIPCFHFLTHKRLSLVQVQLISAIVITIMLTTTRAPTGHLLFHSFHSSLPSAFSSLELH